MYHSSDDVFEKLPLTPPPHPRKHCYDVFVRVENNFTGFFGVSFNQYFLLYRMKDDLIATSWFLCIPTKSESLASNSLQSTCFLPLVI